MDKRKDQTVTPADIDLTPLSVGFDLRIHEDMSTDVPDGTTSMRYKIGSETWRAEGSREELRAELRSAGYRILGDEKEAK